MEVVSFLSLSTLEIKLEGGRKASLGHSHAVIEGTVKGGNFSGKNSFEIKEIRFADRFIPWLKSSCSIDYQRAEITLKDLTFETEDLKSSANHLRITVPQTRSDSVVEIKGVNAAVRERRSLLGPPSRQ
jgi:hypothetical protein